MTITTRARASAYDTAIHAFGCTFPLIAKAPINVGCSVWCWVIFSDFPVPLSLLFQSDTSSVIVFVSLPSHPHQRKPKGSSSWQIRAGTGPPPRRQAPVASRRWPPFERIPPSPAAEAASREQEGCAGRVERGLRRGYPETSGTATRLQRSPGQAGRAPPTAPHPRCTRLSRSPALSRRGGGKTEKASPTALPEPPHSQLPRTRHVLQGSSRRGVRCADGRSWGD
ncbi:FXYD domain-containing ion transport regulator 6 isoform X3 [Pteropus medius]|uniref:FXYD domain-containing ion transport regulator 6 isoform X3 n=1 Tax=Pteropus vampyrus TaxID=132908 RepID=UPI00196B5244|nr:FXYD domain-containing ion transport regulator 6 isoform X3 [Pteropus giganteus]